MTEKAAYPSTLIQRYSAGSIAKYFSLLCVFVFGCSAFSFILFAILGTIRSYSPVPYWDMWDDFVNFYLKASGGDWGAWWQPHNEHRLFLARLFFWLDFRFFGGGGWFSLCMTYLFIFLVGAFITLIWHEQTRPQHAGSLLTGHSQSKVISDWYVLVFLMAWIFSWSQSENLTWAFQIPFILAQLLPLAGLFFLHLSATTPEKTIRYYFASVLLGVLAVGSMANGVLALPVMTLYAIIARMKFGRIAVFAILSVCEIPLYFYHLSCCHFPGGEPSLTGEILHHQRAFIAYILFYIGNPFIHLFINWAHASTPAVLLAGALSAVAFICLTAWSFYRSLAAPRQSALSLALTFFILYIILTAVITAAGRLPLGLPEALSSRYVTPALYGWAALLLLYWPSIRIRKAHRNLLVGALVAIFYFFMFPLQVQALANQRLLVMERELSAMALELQINDSAQINIVYPGSARALAIAREAREQHLSIFGMKPIRDAHLLLGQKINVNGFTPCAGGFLDTVATLPDDPNYFHAFGWLFNSRYTPAPALIYIVDNSNHIAGLGLIGFPREDVAHLKGKKAKYSGFQGYLSSNVRNQKISIVSPNDRCVFSPQV